MPNKVHSRKRNKAGEIQWDIVCEPAILEKLKREERFIGYDCAQALRPEWWTN
jgi:hypothetical protein